MRIYQSSVKCITDKTSIIHRPLLVTSCIIPRDERSETICEAILHALEQKGKNLDEWIVVHEKMFGTNHNIPPGSEIHLSKLEGGLINTDTCNAARFLGQLLVDAVDHAVAEKMELTGEVADNLLNGVHSAMVQDCHHHMRNVWVNAVTIALSVYLNKVLADDLGEIDHRLRVSTMFDAILRALDKAVSLPANYPKGFGDQFKHWLLKYHPGALLVPVQRAAGSRQDLATEGAGAVYWNRIYYVEYLDECLRSGNDNILQENLFIVLTSVEMVALCRIMAIIHFKICMPLRWLAGNTKSIGQQGYNWSTRSMGKAIDALYEAMDKIESDGSLILNELFMNAIFDEIYEDDDGKPCPLPPLQEAMKYHYKEKQTNALDGSKVLPFDLLNAEMFYPERQENKDSTPTVIEMAQDVAAPTVKKEIVDPKKAMGDYASVVAGKYSWGETTEAEHLASIGKDATNDPAESPFAALTQQLQTFGRVLGIHASAIGQARMNGDFNRNIDTNTAEGAYWKLSEEERQSLLTYAIYSAPAVRKEEKVQLNAQREEKLKKKELMRQKKLLACQKEYGEKLMYIDMANSPAFWNSKTMANKEYKKLQSNTAKLNAVKLQIRIHVIGFGWKDLHHPWSKEGRAYTADELFKYLTDTLIPEQKRRGIPKSPEMDLPSRKFTPQLGTRTADVDRLDERYENVKEKAIEEAVAMRNQLEDEGIIDRHEKLQPARPEVDEDLVGAEIEILYCYDEPDGSTTKMWCQGEVVAVRTRNRVHIQWDTSTLRDGDESITEETLLKTKYNKHVIGGWRYSIE